MHFYCREVALFKGLLSSPDVGLPPPGPGRLLSLTMCRHTFIQCSAQGHHPSFSESRNRSQTIKKLPRSRQTLLLSIKLVEQARITRKSPFRGDWIIVICSPEIGANHATVAFAHFYDGFPIRQCLFDVWCKYRAERKPLVGRRIPRPEGSL